MIYMMMIVDSHRLYVGAEYVTYYDDMCMSLLACVCVCNYVSIKVDMRLFVFVSLLTIYTI